MTGDITSPALSADQVTEALRRSGVLGDAVVERITEEPLPALVSRVRRLRLDYAGPAPDAPRTLIAKAGEPGRRTDTAGSREVSFYRDIAPDTPAGLLARCYSAASDAATGAWHLLMEDLGETHFLSPRWPIPPTENQCRTIIATWARFHAAWWDDPRFGLTIGQRHDEATTESYVNAAAECFGRFADLMGERLTPERRAIFERYLNAVPRLFARHRAHRDVTIVHGDAHAWNVLLPREESGDVRLFDWSDWRVSIATGDLAYMMATHWYPERRRRLEKPLLDHYHDALLAHGVRGYDRDRLGDDYRLSALTQIMLPVWQLAYDIPTVIWWSH